MHSHETQLNGSMNAQVVRLLSGVSVHGDQHLAEVERDLLQMNVLLDEAIRKLYASFMAIHQAVDQQQDALTGLQGDSLSVPEYAARVDGLRGEINQHIGAVVTALQFQDMTTQLIGRMGTHLAGLRDVFGALDTEDASRSGYGDDALLAMLNHINERVDERVSGLAGGVRSTVKQRHMESGDVELF